MLHCVLRRTFTHFLAVCLLFPTYQKCKPESDSSLKLRGSERVWPSFYLAFLWFRPAPATSSQTLSLPFLPHIVTHSTLFVIIQVLHCFNLSNILTKKGKLLHVSKVVSSKLMTTLFNNCFLHVLAILQSL